MDPTSFSSSLVGVAVPFLTQAIRRHLLPWNDRAAHFLALAIAAASVSAAYFMQSGPHSLAGWLGNFGAAFTLSQTVYQLVGSELLAGPDTAEAAVPPVPVAFPVVPSTNPTPPPVVPGPDPVTQVTGYPGAAISGTELPKAK